MAYEEIELFAIQRKSVADFGSRFRFFPRREDRDQTLAFLRLNAEAKATDDMEPVRLKIIVHTDDITQLDLFDTG